MSSFKSLKSFLLKALLKQLSWQNFAPMLEQEKVFKCDVRMSTGLFQKPAQSFI